LGRIDRTADLRKAVERVADHLRDSRADVLLIAGDLFSEQCRGDGLRDALGHLEAVLRPFLAGGGTIVALTGNHDNESFCQTLRHALTLAAPAPPAFDACLAPGRLYLATEPSLFRLVDRHDTVVQFLLMPYPTPGRYLDTSGRPFASRQERNRALQASYTDRLKALQRDPAFRPGLPTVLAAHVHVQGARVPNLFRITPDEDILFAGDDVPTQFAYVALGHIHQPQFLRYEHVRYCGSVERLDLAEQHDQKSVVVVEVGPEGLQGEPALLPVEATPIYRVEIDAATLADPRTDLLKLVEQYPDAGAALVRYRLTWQPGRHNREELLAHLETVFPRWYNREVVEAGGGERQGRGGAAPDPRADFRSTVLNYLEEAIEANDPDRADLLALAEELVNQEEGSPP
jgi:DNA repair exonuclease SbcCD nuclease subunit